LDFAVLLRVISHGLKMPFELQAFPVLSSYPADKKPEFENAGDCPQSRMQ